MVYIDKIKKKMSEHDGTKLNKIKIIFQIKKKKQKKTLSCSRPRQPCLVAPLTTKMIGSEAWPPL